MNVLPEKTSEVFNAGDRRFVYGVARRIVHTDEDADDVAQETLLLALRHLSSFRGDSQFRTWLYRIATTTALGHLRRAKRTKDHVPISDVSLVAPDKTAEATVAGAQLDAIVRAAVQSLDPRYRDVVLARAESTEAEVAACLGISVANVKIRAHRARKQLRATLEQAFDPEPNVGVAA